MKVNSLIVLPPGSYCNNAKSACGLVRGATRPSEPSVFIAHPFDPGTAEWVTLLQTELSKYGIKAQLPVSSPGTGILFCKICQQIRESSAIVSELTTLNRNVIFEHGFALGIGCRGVIVRNKNRAVHSILDVLSDIERKDYDNVEEAAEHIAQLASQGDLDILAGTSGEAKILGEWDLSTYPLKPKQVCLLKAGQANTDSIRRLERVLRQSAFEHVVVDPQEYTSHQLFDYARLIKESFAVVGHFVTDQNPNHTTLNALTALLLGLAVGLGKRVAVFQEQPMSHQMVDLGGVLHRYANLEQLQSNLQDHLKVWLPQADAEELAAANVKPKITVPRHVLDIGNPAAEADSLVTKAFLYTQYAEWAQNGQKFLIVGAKGAGKSAIYKFMEEEVEFTSKTKPIFLEFTAFEVRRLMEAADDTAGSIHPDLLFRAFWRSNLLVEVAAAFRSTAGAGYNTSKEFIDLCSWLDDLQLDDTQDYFDRFLKVAGLGGMSLSELTKEQFVALRFNRAEQWLRELLKGWQFVVFADKLDESWETGNERQREYLRAFVHECFLLSNSLSNMVKPVLFLRKDILAELRVGEAEADKWNIGTIEWTKPELVKMLEERVKVSENLIGKDFSWNEFLPQAFRGQRSIDYLLDRTYLTPRDAIVLLQWIINYAQSEGGLPASEAVVRRALKTFSENRLVNLDQEVHVEGGVAILVRALLPVFAKGFEVSERVTLDALVASGSGEIAMTQLYDAGVLCYVDGEQRLMSSRTHSFAMARNLAKDVVTVSEIVTAWLLVFKRKNGVESRSPAVSLHPALHGLLDKMSEPVVFRADVHVAT